jgi:hypothetical protein
MNPIRQSLYIDRTIDPKLEAYLSKLKVGDNVEFHRLLFTVAETEEKAMRLTLKEVQLSQRSEPVETQEPAQSPRPAEVPKVDKPSAAPIPAPRDRSPLDVLDPMPPPSRSAAAAPAMGMGSLAGPAALAAL